MIRRNEIPASPPPRYDELIKRITANIVSGFNIAVITNSHPFLKGGL